MEGSAGLSETAVSAGAPAVKFTLRFGSNGGQPQDFTLGKDSSVRIGRCPKSDVTVNLPGVSWNHAELRMREVHGEWRLCVVDLSSNATGLKVPGEGIKRLKRGEDTEVIDAALVVLPMKIKAEEGKNAMDLRMCFTVEFHKEMEDPGGMVAAEPQKDASQLEQLKEQTEEPKQQSAQQTRSEAEPGAKSKAEAAKRSRSQNSRARKRSRSNRPGGAGGRSRSRSHARKRSRSRGARRPSRRRSRRRSRERRSRQRDRRSRDRADRKRSRSRSQKKSKTRSRSRRRSANRGRRADKSQGTNFTTGPGSGSDSGALQSGLPEELLQDLRGSVPGVSPAPAVPAAPAGPATVKPEATMPVLPGLAALVATGPTAATPSAKSAVPQPGSSPAGFPSSVNRIRGLSGVEMCGDFKRGACTRGDKCRYSHGEAGGGSGASVAGGGVANLDLAAAAAKAAAALMAKSNPDAPAAAAAVQSPPPAKASLGGIFAAFGAFGQTAKAAAPAAPAIEPPEVGSDVEFLHQGRWKIGTALAIVADGTKVSVLTESAQLEVHVSLVRRPQGGLPPAVTGNSGPRPTVAQHAAVNIAATSKAAGSAAAPAGPAPVHAKPAFGGAPAPSRSPGLSKASVPAFGPGGLAAGVKGPGAVPTAAPGLFSAGGTAHFSGAGFPKASPSSSRPP